MRPRLLKLLLVAPCVEWVVLALPLAGPDAGSMPGFLVTYSYPLLLLAFKLLIETPITIVPLRRSVRGLVPLILFIIGTKAVAFVISFLLSSALDPGLRTVLSAIFEATVITAAYHLRFRNPQADRPRRPLFVAAVVVLAGVVGGVLSMAAELPLFTLYIRLIGAAR